VQTNLISHFPPDDLCQTLIDLYFIHINTYFPLLHRPTFQRQWDDRLHNTNFWFASACLMLFACASRWSTDDRVLGDPTLWEKVKSQFAESPFQDGEAEAGRDSSSVEQIPDTEKSTTASNSQSAHEKKWWFAGLPFFQAAGGEFPVIDLGEILTNILMQF